MPNFDVDLPMQTISGNVLTEDAFGKVDVMDYGAAGDGVTDDTAAVQAAVDQALALDRNLFFPSGKSFLFKGIWLKEKPLNWVILAHGATFVHPDNAASEDAMFFNTALDAPGGTARTTRYNQEVHFLGGKFTGQGFGVGVKAFIVAAPRFSNVEFDGLGTSVKCMGTTGLSVSNCRFRNATDAHLHFAKNSNDSASVNYTAENIKWNDGIKVDSNYFSGAARNILHEGSLSEGVINITSNIFANATDATIELISPMTAVHIQNNWTEFHDGASTDLIRLLKDPDNGFESRGPACITGNHLYSNSTDTINYAVYTEWANTEVQANTFQLTDGSVTGAIYFQSGGSRAADTPATITPLDTSMFYDEGEIVIDEGDLPGSFRDAYYITVGSREYILKYKSKSTTAVTFTIHRTQKVYSEQFPAYGPNWLNVASVDKAVSARGIVVDFDLPTTGDNFTGPDIDILNAVNGSVRDKALMQIQDNHVIGLSPELFFQKREFGRAILNNNSFD